MNETLLARLQAVDPTILTGVVRQDQRSASMEIVEWSVRRLSDKGIANPDGLWLVSGRGQVDGDTRSWSVVVKIIRRPDSEVAPTDLSYWKREFLVAQSGLLADLPGPVLAPRFYLVNETEDSIWLWMEHLQSASNHEWTIDDYAFASRQLGRWNGCYLAGTPTPDYPWLAVDHCQSWIGQGDPAEAWKDPRVAMNFSDTDRSRHMEFSADRESFIDILKRLPQVFSHFDYQRRNLFLHEVNGAFKTVYAIDWAICGHGAIGSDLCALILTSIIVFELPFVFFNELEAAVNQAYLDGLRDAGWQGPAELARLGYLAYSSLWFTLIFPRGVAWWSADEQQAFAMQQFGLAGDELMKAYAIMFPALLDRVDEARNLINHSSDYFARYELYMPSQ